MSFNVKNGDYGISAAGTATASATALPANYQFAQISTCATGAGVRLPVSAPGTVYTIRNDGASALAVYPVSGEKINGGTADIAVMIPPQRSADFVCSDGDNYYSAYNACPSNKVETIAAARTMLAGESGQTYLVNPASAYTITLPAPSAGLYYKFLSSVVAANLVRVDAGAGLLNGNGIITSATPTGVVGSASQYLGFVASCPLGTVMEFVSDGTNWYVNAATSVAAKIAFT